MPVKKCSNNKWRIGDGKCMYKSKASAERAYAAYRAVSHSENMKFLKSFKLFENPNAIAKNGKNIEWTQEDSLCFSYYDGEFAIREESTHGKLAYEFTKNKKLIDPNFEIKQPTIYGRGKYAERIFPEQKVLTFWEFPESKQILDEIIENIEANGYEIDDEYLIEVNDNTEKEKSYDYVDQWGDWDCEKISKIRFIPIDEYKGSGTKFNTGFDKPHIISPLLKQRKKGRQPLSWKQALLKSESKV